MKRASLPALLHDSTLSPELIEQLHAEPWRFGFLSLLRRIGAHPGLDPIGTARRPRSEPFRLGQQPSLAFAPSEIARAQAAAGQLKIRLFSLGMLGPNGPLPLHVTEIAKDREDSRRDSTTVDFLDIFHHRFFTLFYRAWASAQSTAGLDRKNHEQFSFYIASLAGQDIGEISQRPLPPHARLAASAHLVRESRNPDGLRATLEQYFGVPVAIEENVFHWIALDPADQGRMGRPGAAAIMGQGAMLGRVVPDRQHRFRIVIGPLDLGAYLRFTPQGEDLPRLVEWVRTFVGYELEWELELRIKPESAPPVVMGGQQRMGWSGWLGRPAPHKPITGMRFEPERYARYFKFPPSRH
ncbi:type VI secretion system baseplate subunit TssG [Paraburkholderia hayleyella]|uniref:type VI secretion system baseplate subunit TssG n=1 Tax=Paraburkholderia hayleyella TaxID=2152889 RepID=UPI0012923021|nr:type VI secretion system baseplate subunit TssG [Paraburkholderia hayleyella]